MSDEFDFEEVNLTCGVCGKDKKTLIYKGYDTSDFVCPRCNLGEMSADEDEVGGI